MRTIEQICRDPYYWIPGFEERVRTDRSLLQLGRIADHRLRLDRVLLDADAVAANVISLITDPERFLACFKAPPSQQQLDGLSRKSYRMSHAVSTLVDACIVSRAPPVLCLLAFLVPKKDGSGRLVLDGA